MISDDPDWQRACDDVVHAARNHSALATGTLSIAAAATLLQLQGITKVEIGRVARGAAFRFDEKRKTLRLSRSGLNLIYKAGKKAQFGGLAEDDFCAIALSLYLFHEVHHLLQGLAAFDRVQALKAAGGALKLGELDLSADAVAAQVFASIEAKQANGDPKVCLAVFYLALCFMIQFCFPAFKFPIDKKHKVRRALGITIMAVYAEGALVRQDVSSDIFQPVYPIISDDFSEIVVMTTSARTGISTVVDVKSLHPETTKALLANIDNGDVAGILTECRAIIV